MTIKHLVIGGGGPFGISAFGALQYLHEKLFWNIKDIKTIYATSIGAIVAVYLSLGYDYSYINEYIVKRPWEKIFQEIGFHNILDLYENKGLIDMNPIIIKKFNILFEAKNLSIDINLKDFYEYSGIEFNFISCDANSFTRITISHKTYPDMKLIQALCITSAFPIVFTPVIIDDKCFIDGGIFSNYAVNVCLEETGCRKEEILGIKKYQSPDDNDFLLNRNSNIFDFLEKISMNIYNRITDQSHLEIIPYQIDCNMNIFTTVDSWVQVPFSIDHRIKLLSHGVEAAEKCIEKFIAHRETLLRDNEYCEVLKTGDATGA
jgi:predicted patatin/cPLA2 family phospholipase